MFKLRITLFKLGRLRLSLFNVGLLVFFFLGIYNTFSPAAWARVSRSINSLLHLFSATLDFFLTELYDRCNEPSAAIADLCPFRTIPSTSLRLVLRPSAFRAWSPLRTA